MVIYDVADATGEKRLAQVVMMLDHLLPKGYARETFAHRQANTLDAARIAELSKFVETV